MALDQDKTLALARTIELTGRAITANITSSFASDKRKQAEIRKLVTLLAADLHDYIAQLD